MADYNRDTFGKRGYAAHKNAPPCYGCNERYEGCHGKCERYIKWKAENDEYRETFLKDKHENADVISFEIRKRKTREY